MTQETRTVFCASKSGTIYNETFCANRKLPELKRDCETSVDCEYLWFKSQWSSCSADCGKGIQNRRVICGQFKGGAVSAADDESKCDAAEKPDETRECEGKTKECLGQWFTGPWSECNKPCGGGIRSRKVLCILNGVPGKPSDCTDDNIEFSSEDCNVAACLEDETLPVDVTSKPIEEDDEGEEYCDEDDDIEAVGDDDTTESIDAKLSSGISDGIDLDGTDATESTITDDDLMLSDATYETDSLTDETSTDITSKTFIRHFSLFFLISILCIFSFK